MKRAVIAVIFLGAVAALGSCSSNSRDGDCYRDSDCDDGYQCDDYSGECVALPGGSNEVCTAPADCSSSYTCSRSGLCLPGDCYFNGCVTGFQCQSSSGRWECAPGSSGTAGASNGDTNQAGTSGVVDAAGQAG